MVINSSGLCQEYFFLIFIKLYFLNIVLYSLNPSELTHITTTASLKSLVKIVRATIRHCIV